MPFYIISSLLERCTLLIPAEFFCVAGYKVSGTVRKGVLQLTVYEGAELELMLGMFAVLSKWHVTEYIRMCLIYLNQERWHFGILKLNDPRWSTAHVEYG